MNTGRGGGSGPQRALTLREESRGKKQMKPGSGNLRSVLKMQHLQKLAIWTTSGETPVPPLGAFFGHQMAVFGESMGVPPDPSFFPCQSCESILQPGYNCTVRIEKNKAKARQGRRKPTQNSVVYWCKFCSHRNLRRGTPKGHVKKICPWEPKPSSKSKGAKSKTQKSASVDSSKSSIGSRAEFGRIDDVASTAIPEEISTVNSSLGVETFVAAASPAVEMSPATPLPTKGAALLDSKKRIRKRPGSKSAAKSENASAEINAGDSVSGSRKRRRKGWTSLKEIAEANERNKIHSTAGLSIPFDVQENGMVSK